MSVESEHFDIKPNSALHERIKKEVIDRRSFSLRKMKDYHNRWDEQDETIRAYIPETEVEAKQKNAKRFKRDFDYISLELPYSFAIIMTAHTYWSSVFLSRTPVYQYTGRHGEPMNQVNAVEAIMDYQLHVGLHLPVLYNWLYDMAKYGLGIVGNYWEKEEITCVKIEERPVSLLGVSIGHKTEKVRVEETLVGYEGNKLYNIRPHDWFPDPRVSIFNFQDGEFCGRDTTESFLSLNASGYINIEHAQKTQGQKDGWGAGGFATNDTQGTSQIERPVQPNEPQIGIHTANVHEMVIRIIPKNWGLGKSEKSEMWVFTLANLETIIGCRPLGLYHNKFPFSVIEYGMGASEFVKLSMIDIIKPMTDTLSWLFNVHFFNVRKALNDTRVVDPSRIRMSDVLKPGAGGVIKLTPEAYGTNPKDAIHQLQVTDVTRSHLGDSQFVETMVQRVTGVVDNIMGMVNTSGRKTATEVRTSTGFSTNRLKTPAEYASAVGWGPLSQMLLQNTQQLYDDEKRFRVAGTLNIEQGEDDQAVMVSPEMIAGFYNFVPVDGSLPVDRLAQANVWKELLAQLGSNPAIMQRWDVGGMLAHAMKLTGERNVDRFRLKIGSDASMMNAAAAGNIVPLGGEGGESSGRPAPRTSRGIS